jgi:hypothetical protein
MTLSDKAFNTLNLLRHAGFLDWEEPFRVSGSVVSVKFCRFLHVD